MFDRLNTGRKMIQAIRKSVLNTILVVLAPVIFIQSCSINKFVIRQTGTILDYSVIALYEETDLTLAEQALEVAPEDVANQIEAFISELGEG